MPQHYRILVPLHSLLTQPQSNTDSVMAVPPHRTQRLSIFSPVLWNVALCLRAGSAILGGVHALAITLLPQRGLTQTLADAFFSARMRKIWAGLVDRIRPCPVSVKTALVLLWCHGLPKGNGKLVKDISARTTTRKTCTFIPELGKT